MSLLPPAFGRLAAYITHEYIPIIVLALMYASVLACMLGDMLRHERLHSAMVHGGLPVLACDQPTYLVQVMTP